EPHRPAAPYHAPSSPTCNSLIPSSRTTPFANRPPNFCVGADVPSAQAESSSAAPSRTGGRHESGMCRLERARLEGHTFSRVVTVPFPLVIPSAARNLLFSAPTTPTTTQKSEPPQPPSGAE